MDSTLYNINWTYEENFKKGPVGLAKQKEPTYRKVEPRFKFLGFPINIPYGIASGPLINSKFIKAAFEFGFSTCTYKTVRTQSFPPHPFPNVVYVDAPEKLDPLKTPSLTLRHSERSEESQGKKSRAYEKISITNSFGVPSKDPKFWQKDVKKASAYEKRGQVLILGFMGTVRKNQTEQEFVEDFIEASLLSRQTRVKVLEVNLSCPNIGNEGLVCYDLRVTEKICKSIRKAIGNTPLIIKVGYYHNDKDIETIAKIANEYANAIAAINTIQVAIVDKNGKQALPGPNRLKSGVGGHAIKWAGIEMVNKLNKLRKKRNYKFEIVGIGGVMNATDYFEYRKAGADLVQSATGAMWNPYLATEIRQKENI